MRYYTADKNVTCRNCSRPGHLSKNCPTPKVNATLQLLVDAAVASNTLLCLPLKALPQWFIISLKGCSRLRDSLYKISLLYKISCLFCGGHCFYCFSKGKYLLV